MSEEKTEKQSQKRPYVRKTPWVLTPGRISNLDKANKARKEKREALLQQIKDIEENNKESGENKMEENTMTSVETNVNTIIPPTVVVPEVQKDDESLKRKREVEEKEIIETKEEEDDTVDMKEDEEESSYDPSDMVEEIQNQNELQDIMQKIRERTIPQQTAPIIRESSVQRTMTHKAARPDPTVAFLEHTQHFNAFTQHPSRLITSNIHSFTSTNNSNSSSSFIWL